MEWTDAQIEQITVLWSEGHSTAEIGRRMNISKNAVVGKAHRLDLPQRPSVIIQAGQRREYVPRPRAPMRTLPTMAPPQPAPRVTFVAPVRAETPKPAPRIGRVTCCWPIGTPGTAAFRFCDDTTSIGRHYCDTHHAIAYVRVRDRREDAA